MSYRVLVGGVPIEADSMEEALALAQRLGGLKPEASKARPVAQVADRGAHAWGDFLASITPKQREALQVIRSTPGLTMGQIAERLGFEKANQASGVIGGGLRKNLAKFHLDRGQVIKTRTVSGENHYYPGKILEANEP
jgi:hypothetical protein